MPKKNVPIKEELVTCKTKWKKRVLIATPTEGWVRYEWSHARFGQIVPMNWTANGFDIAYTALGYGIDDAYNMIVEKAIELGVEWLVTIEDDVLLPPDCFSKLDRYMMAAEQDRENNEPIVSGLYYLKAEPTLPLVFRGRGNGAFTNFKIGKKVYCDGLPMGCLLIHMDIIKYFYKKAETYRTCDGQTVHRVFETPQKTFYDPEVGGYGRMSGTQDLFFFDKVIEEKVLSKCGFKKAARRKFPFLCDTSIFCRHIDRQTGRQYP